MKDKIKVGSLFAGVGGICLGFMEAMNPEAEYTLSWANEIDSYACITYRQNFSHPLLEGDINYILNPDQSTDRIDRVYHQSLQNIIVAEPIDVLAGGFPCQAFSVAGERRGFADERGNLFLSFIHFVDLHHKKFNVKPRFLFLENVKHLKNHDGGRTYKIIKSELEGLGYTVKESILNTMTYTHLPQNRERIYIIGFLDPKDAKRFDFFDRLSDYKIDKTPEERKGDIKEIIDHSELDDRYFYTKEKYPHYFVSGGSDQINLTESIDEMYQFYQIRRGKYVRKNQSNVCPTLTANMGTGGHNVPLILTKDGIRKLTPAETFKLQGFSVGQGYELPKSYGGRKYPDSQLYKQAGNAVSVPIIKLLAEEMLKIIIK